MTLECPVTMEQLMIQGCRREERQWPLTELGPAPTETGGETGCSTGEAGGRYDEKIGGWV